MGPGDLSALRDEDLGSARFPQGETHYEGEVALSTETLKSNCYLWEGGRFREVTRSLK